MGILGVTMSIINIQIISFAVVLFIALCAAMHLWSNRVKSLIAGEPIIYGSLVAIGTDGKVYNTKPCDLPLGICTGESQ